MFNDAKPPIALLATDVPPRAKLSNYPEPFFSRMAGRDKRPLGDLFGLTNFGVNLTRLKPGGSSALRHTHTKQDEVVYLEIGDRTDGDAVTYPDDDLAVVTIDGRRRMAHKDGTPY